MLLTSYNWSESSHSPPASVRQLPLGTLIGDLALLSKFAPEKASSNNQTLVAASDQCR